MQFCLLNTNCNDNNASETFYCCASAQLPDTVVMSETVTVTKI